MKEFCGGSNSESDGNPLGENTTFIGAQIPEQQGEHAR